MDFMSMLTAGAASFPYFYRSSNMIAYRVRRSKGAQILDKFAAHKVLLRKATTIASSSIERTVLQHHRCTVHDAAFTLLGDGLLIGTVLANSLIL
ncbi:hypothetical protein QA635_32270 [Bradyrhizobium brasilense]|uniref:hypothetical protein n=1 Tax=Bradyrhizobium brasilense TaxID=1419277 RepID=UPI0024B1812A|nr:hypothetical protein [Bradyrhizobium australafricanum]WFU31204.1 hypothetical protein QA635_32270 [Bradyrhizobium australafricanum]